jgi:hypothetical protein
MNIDLDSLRRNATTHPEKSPTVVLSFFILLLPHPWRGSHTKGGRVWTKLGLDTNEPRASIISIVFPIAINYNCSHRISHLTEYS